MAECNVVFFPEGKTVQVNKGQTLLEAAQMAGIYVHSICAGEGICGKCKVIVREGSVSTVPTSLLTREEIQRSFVLACQTTVNSDVEVELPLETRLEEVQILTETERKKRLVGLFGEAEEVESQEKLEKKLKFSISPLARKVYLELPEPSLDDNLSDLHRIYRELKRKEKFPVMQTGLANIKKIPSLLRASDWKVTVTLGRRNGTVELVQFEGGDTASRNYGVAIDIGTTTVVASLVDLNTGATVATKANYNTQVSYGEDVITRIIYAGEPNGLQRLNTAVVENINGLIGALVTDNNIKFSDITAVLASGNTTMIHLLLGIDPAYIRQEPYVPSANLMPVIRAAEIGIKINPRGLLAALPGVSSYVGSDITAGVLASGMTEFREITLLMDIGTNGEIVLGNSEWLMCASCSAGPAFEGGGVKCGMRASKGAIQSLKINHATDVIKYSTIGNVLPRGLCGSGLIDTLAELMRYRIIDRAGRINREMAWGRIIENEEGPEYILARQEESAIENPIVITENDIANIIRSKGAMFVGTEFLLKKAGLTFNDIHKFYIAGGFGNYLNIENAIIIGLLPDLPLEKFQFIGNSSLTGAKMSLVSKEAYERAVYIAENMTNFELSVEPGFMNEYTSALFLPHTNLELFPNVAGKLGWG